MSFSCNTNTKPNLLCIAPWHLQKWPDFGEIWHKTTFSTLKGHFFPPWILAVKLREKRNGQNKVFHCLFFSLSLELEWNKFHTDNMNVYHEKCKKLDFVAFRYRLKMWQINQKLCGVNGDECLCERQYQNWFACFRSRNEINKSHLVWPIVEKLWNSKKIEVDQYIFYLTTSQTGLNVDHIRVLNNLH